MLHIKDIEAFARINEALARLPVAPPRPPARPPSIVERGDEPAKSNPAVLFARLATSMMAPPTALWASAQAKKAAKAGSPPLPAPTPANDALAAEPAPVIVIAASSPIPEPVAPRVMVAESTVTLEDEEEALDEALLDGAASVDAIPLATAEVLPFPGGRRERDVVDAGAVGGIGYDFDLFPRRANPMTALFGRFFFGRR